MTWRDPTLVSEALHFRMSEICVAEGSGSREFHIIIDGWWKTAHMDWILKAFISLITFVVSPSLGFLL